MSGPILRRARSCALLLAGTFVVAVSSDRTELVCPFFLERTATRNSIAVCQSGLCVVILHLKIGAGLII